jgi:hypothetical protein
VLNQYKGDSDSMSNAIKKYEATIVVGQSTISILSSGRVLYPSKMELSPSENAAVTLIAEILRKLRADKSIELEIPPSMLMEIEPLIMCEWLDSGSLKIHEKQPERKWQHADSALQATAAKRSFTCYRSLLPQIPQKRTPQMAEQARMSLLGDRETYEE